MEAEPQKIAPMRWVGKRPRKPRARQKEYWLKYKVRLDEQRLAKAHLLKQYKGGKCFKCGYNKCEAALDFHHVLPDMKSFVMSMSMTRSMDVLMAEADKCVLLCANCHREEHTSKQ